MAILNDKDLLEQWDKHKNISEGSLSYQYSMAREAHLAHSGDDSYFLDNIPDKDDNKLIVFNSIKPFIDAVHGFMIQLRRKAQYIAKVTDARAQQLKSEFMNSVKDYMRDQTNLDQIESRQDLEMLITGYGAIDSNILYEKNPDGEMCGELIRYDDVGWDPQSEETNLLDARWVYRRKAFSQAEALDRFVGSKAEDFESYSGETELIQDFDSLMYGAQFIGGTGYKEEDLVQVYYYQYWTLEKYYRSPNPLYSDNLSDGDKAYLGQILDKMRRDRIEESKRIDPTSVDDIFEFDPFAEHLIMTPSVRSDVKGAFKVFNVDVPEQRYMRRVYYTAIVSGETVLKKFKSPDQNGFTIKFKTANYDSVNRVWYGMVHPMIKPSLYMSKAFTELLFVISSTSKAGVMYEESAVDDAARFEQEFASTKGAVRVNDGAIQQGQIRDKAQAHMPTGLENIFQFANQALNHSSGLGESFLGMATSGQTSGILESQRINQVISKLAMYFDSISLFQKEQGRLEMTFIRMLAQNSQGRLIALTGENGERFYDYLKEENLSDEYDIEIIEAPITPVQRQETGVIMLQMAEKMQQQGKNIYPFVIDYIPNLKESDKLKLKQAITPTPESIEAQQRIAQQESELERAMQMSVVESQKAKAQKDLADSLRSQAQREETVAQTVKTLQEAEQKKLENDVIKTKTIDEIDLVI